MSLISLFISNEYAQLLLSVVALLFLFYALGRIIQSYFKFNRSNIYISIPIGLFTYMLINQMAYTLIILTGLGVETLSIIDTIKGLSVILFVGVSYEAWLPKFTWVGTKTVLYSILSLSIVLTVYALMFIFIGSFGKVDPLWISAIDNIKDTGVYQIIGDDGVNLSSVIDKYQSTYYWIFINSSFSTAGTANVINIEISSIFIIATTLAIQSSFINHEKSVTSVFFATLLATAVAVILGFTSPTNDMFYTLSIIIILFTQVYDYASKKDPSENTITFALVGTLVFITVGSNSLAYITLIGLSLITITAIRGGNIVRNTIHYLLILMSLSAWFVITTFLFDITMVSQSIIYLVVFAIMFIFMFLPLYSLGYTQSRRAELVSFEKAIKNRLSFIIISTAISVLLLSLFIDWINENNTIEELQTFFMEFSLFNTKLWIGITVYLAVIVLPTILILIMMYFGKKSVLLSLFAFFNIMINPITVVTFAEMFNIAFSVELIILPSIMMLLSFALREFVRRIPTLH